MPTLRLFDNQDTTDRLIVYGKIQSIISSPFGEDLSNQYESIHYPMVEKVIIKYTPSVGKAFEGEFDVRSLCGPSSTDKVFVRSCGNFKDIIISTDNGIVNIHLYRDKRPNIQSSFGVVVSADDEENCKKGGRIYSNHVSNTRVLAY